MPSKKIPSPQCGQPKAATSEKSRECKPSYRRTDEHRQRMSQRLRGKSPRGFGWRHSPETRQKMRNVWTPEKKSAKSQEVLARNPDARYHGLSAKAADRLVHRVGHCERCQHDGSVSRLGVHHRNRDKHDHRLENLEILCHRCHMQEHAAKGETGWSLYHRKRKMTQG